MIVMQYGSGNGQKSGMRNDLLWSNDSPSASFGAQTVSLDLSGYSSVKIYLGAGTEITTVVEIPSGFTFSARHISNSGNNLRYFYRTITPSNTGVAFTGCSYRTNGSGSTGTSNTTLIPLLIYGIKN